MAPFIVDGNNLGQIHQNYNALIKKVKVTNESGATEVNDNDDDVDNLMRIDLACSKRDIEYILNVLKTKDSLYVSRAINKSPWLIADDYAYIINPSYLHTKLLPQMTTKAGIKLINHIRLHLKNEPRVEEFYLNEKILKNALKWLPHCSVSFIKQNIDKHYQHIEHRVYKRLCEKSISILEQVIQNKEVNMKKSILESTVFYLKTKDIEKYLDLVESVHTRESPNFSANATDVIMKYCTDRVIDKFPTYVTIVNISIFVKYIKKEDVIPFLYKHANSKDDETEHPYFRKVRRIFKFDVLKHFINVIPAPDRFNFVKKVFIDKIHKDDENALNMSEEVRNMRNLFNLVISKEYDWYEFATFDVAYTEIRKMINAKPSQDEIYAMLSILNRCAGKNIGNKKSLLKYYKEKHVSDNITLKYRFVNQFLSLSNINDFDTDIWNELINIFTIMNVYLEPNNISKEITEAIILHSVLHNDKVPETIIAQFSCDSLKQYRNKLTESQKEKVFKFLYELMWERIQNKTITNESDFSDTIRMLESMFALLLDWNKHLQDYPSIGDKIREFLKLKKQNCWKTSFSKIYNINKQWRKNMFEESITMYPSEAVLINALKHDPGLLSRYNDEVESICFKDNKSLNRLHSKLRIYWTHSLAEIFIQKYSTRIENTDEHRAVVSGLLNLLSFNPLHDFINKYAPKEDKINWNNADEKTISLQRNIAKNMHLSRPQPIVDAILSYAKGDYLQYALPSLLAIFYNLNSDSCREYIPKLINSQVSLQKHGLRLAYDRFQPEELKEVFSNAWVNTKNNSIRAVIFKFTHNLFCNANSETNAEGLWTLLEMFIDNLSYTEDTSIYDLLGDVEKLPSKIRAQYIVKCYRFLQNFHSHSSNSNRDKYTWALDELANASRDLMEFIDQEFVIQIITDFIEKSFFHFESKMPYLRYVAESSGMIPVLSAYLLCSKDENSQLEKYKRVLVPIIERAFTLWNETHNGKYYIRINFQELLSRLSLDLANYVVEKKMVIPLNMFTKILNELETLVVSENYVLITKWKLTVALTHVVDKTEQKDKWDDVHPSVAPTFGRNCLELLKQDVTAHFPCIYVLFSKALGKTLNDVIPEESEWVVYECLLSDNEFIQGFLTAIKLYPRYPQDKLKEKADNIRKLLISHPSAEVRMHYYSKFKEEKLC